jgi:hypothetical protein
MNQGPRIKPTSINGNDANHKAVDELAYKRVDDRWTPRSADLGWGRPT